MGVCERCGREFEAYCAKCRDEIRNQVRSEKQGKLIPLMWLETDKKGRKYYRFACHCTSCPCNAGKGMCNVRYTRLPLDMMHEWDGDNIIRARCG